MERIYQLQNEFIQIAVKQTGAELCSVKNLLTDKEYMWNADPEIWAGYSPVLFPIVGALKDNNYIYKGVIYSLPQHGFIRNQSVFGLLSQTTNELYLTFQNNQETLKKYPFLFEITIGYALVKNTLTVHFEVKNMDRKEMLFSLGAHPAFKCPIDTDETYSDYSIEFEQPETASTYKIEAGGLIGEKSDLILKNNRTINLHYKLFDKGALVFKDLKSRKVCLTSKISGKRLEMNFEGFPYFGIWAKPNADYVCLEPWIGIADSVNADQVFEHKEGIIHLPASRSFMANYSMEFF